MKRLRRVKTVDPWVFCSVDYGALELCTLAQITFELFGQSAMRDAINEGQDLHARLAGRFMGVNYAEAMRLKKAGDKRLGQLRQAAKPVNFGIPGLMGPPKLVATARKDDVRFCELAGLSQSCANNKKRTEYARRKISPTCEVCLDLAITFTALYKEEFPEVVDYHKATIAQADLCAQGIPLESFGTGMLRLETNANGVSNHFFQNLAAQGAKHAGWLLAKESYTDRSSVLFNNLRLVAFIHDEGFTEVREAVAHEAALRQAEIQIAAMREYTPDVTITAVPALARRWFKGMEAVYDKAGRLKPWWPTDKRCKPVEHQHVEGCGCWKHEADQDLMISDLAA